MDVATWLQELSLERYVQAFRDNEIDERTLPSLTAEDLKDLGVTLVGHRRRLLDAIAMLSGAAAPSAETPAAPVAVHASAREAERRQLTVMFCDLVGSTSLASKLDPEDLHEVIGAYHRAVAETVGRFAGFVAKYMGDGVLIYFGYPEAHEDDAERTVRAGLALLDAVGRLGGSETLQTHIGVATGLVVVGDLIGEGARSAAWLARHQTWQPVWKRSPPRARWSSPTPHDAMWARCSTSKTSGRGRSPGSPRSRAPGA
jgi:class 3 adenylate cyclase